MITSYALRKLANQIVQVEFHECYIRNADEAVAKRLIPRRQRGIHDHIFTMSVIKRTMVALLVYSR